MGDNEINSLIRLQERVHRKLLDHRAFERLISSEKFDEAYIAASIDSRNQLNKIVDMFDIEALKSWIARAKPIDSLSFRELREICKAHNVFKWSRLDKHQLLETVSEIQLRASQKSS